jgi:hypothetical protein
MTFPNLADYQFVNQGNIVRFHGLMAATMQMPDPVSETFHAFRTSDDGQSPKTYFFHVQYTIVRTLYN